MQDWCNERHERYKWQTPYIWMSQTRWGLSGLVNCCCLVQSFHNWGKIWFWFCRIKIYILIIQDGIGYSFGVFLPSLSEYFGTNKASTAVVFSVMNFCIQVDIILYWQGCIWSTGVSRDLAPSPLQCSVCLATDRPVCSAPSSPPPPSSSPGWWCTSGSPSSSPTTRSPGPWRAWGWASFTWWPEPWSMSGLTGGWVWPQGSHVRAPGWASWWWPPSWSWPWTLSGSPSPSSCWALSLAQRRSSGLL